MRAIEDPRLRRLARISAHVCWWGLLAYFVRATLKARDVNPEHLLSLAVLGYLAGWGPFMVFSRWSPGGKVARFAACSASVVLALIVIELPAVFHLIDYRSVFHTPTPAWRRSGNSADPDLLYVREPNQRLRLKFQGADLHGLSGASASRTYRCETMLDGGGFRNPVDLDSASVAIVGDSFVEGLQVADDELVSAQLAKLLNAPVANLGRTGYGPQQELHVLRRYGVGLRPRTCVWAFYEGNDLQDVRSYESERERVRKLRPEPVERVWYGRSFVRNGAAYLIRQGAGEPTTPARLQAGLFGDSTGGATEIYFSCGVHEGVAEGAVGRCESDELKRFQSILGEARALCREWGVDLVVAFVPAKFRVYRDLCQFDPESPCRAWPIDDLPSAVEQAVRAASAEIGFVDLTPVMRARAEAGELVYLVDDTHWSPEGHRAAASALAEFISEGGNGRSSVGGRPGVDHLEAASGF